MSIAWNIGAASGIWCLFYVMLKARLWVCNDPPWLMYSRFFVFVATCAGLSVSISLAAYHLWTPEFPETCVLYGGLTIILTNAVSLHLRVRDEEAAKCRICTEHPSST